ncbi:DUF1640 domain-containing protein [Paenibacillus cremeus]|uniref:DUF1640 domain-containing protein n=1 Tax=Paenibacillus cremeus TaxID=2163881 RepID=A0A559K5Q7_9BACL|nr:DUF1640 domain-containing protein [Paenibacillus cremeus]TVY07433.1 DUF1640 domain-containing protein [Paenibacillus cremeus]
MEREWMDAFRLVMREELEPFKQELKAEMTSFKQDIQAEMTSFKQELRAEMTSFKQDMQAEIVSLKREMEVRFDRVDERLDRIEVFQNEDVVAMLHVIQGKIETCASKEDVMYLAGKLGEHDLALDQLKRVK